MIIVEGFDNTGKSTLVKRLSKDLKLLAMNNQQRPETPTDAMDYLSVVFLAGARFPIILDRLAIISEPIYGPICRNHHLFQPHQVRQELDRLQNNKPIIIYCRPSDETILNFGETEQMEGVVDRGPALLKAYDESIERLIKKGFFVIKYNWEKGSYEQLCTMIKEQL